MRAQKLAQINILKSNAVLWMENEAVLGYLCKRFLYSENTWLPLTAEEMKIPLLKIKKKVYSICIVQCATFVNNMYRRKVQHLRIPLFVKSVYHPAPYTMHKNVPVYAALQDIRLNSRTLPFKSPYIRFCICTSVQSQGAIIWPLTHYSTFLSFLLTPVQIPVFHSYS
jgi:hypothetical protein